MTNEININDTVRSFDFHNSRDIEGPDACFVEGIVEGFKEVEGCTRFEIKVTREVFRGEERQVEEGERVFPPLNGTPTNRGRITDGVVKVEESTRAMQIADMEVSNLSDEQIMVICNLTLRAEEGFLQRARSARNDDERNGWNSQADACLPLLGRLRDEKETRTEAA